VTRPAFEAAFDAARRIHTSHFDLACFVDWDPAATWAGISPFHMPSAQNVPSDRSLAEAPGLPERDAFIAPAPFASWRQSYSDEQIGSGFNERFGSYQLIGPEGHFHSASLSTFVLYAAANLWYPWHDHPAEELYLILAGEAEFFAAGRASRTLRPGDTAIHLSCQPHAMQTHDSPVLAYVLWRSDLESKPRLTPPDELPPT